MSLIGREHIRIEDEKILILLKCWDQEGFQIGVYQNHDMSSRLIGHLKFLKLGEGCTYQIPPKRMPDTAKDINWQYVFVGYLREIMPEVLR